jgi:arsenate reductase-like glutaredoxin family protein
MRWYRRRTGYDSAMAQPPAPSVQVFGLVDDQPTRAAIRFFKERRFTIHFVDLRRKPIAPGEMRRFTDRLGPRAVLDIDGPMAREAGLGAPKLTDAEIIERLLADGRLLAEGRVLRLPLVRYGNALTAGRDETAWRAWLASPRPG